MLCYCEDDVTLNSASLFENIDISNIFNYLYLVSLENYKTITSQA